MSGSPAITLIQTSVDAYRQAFVEEVAARIGRSFQIYTGDTYFDPAVRTRVVLPGHVTRVRNVFLVRRLLLWQRGAVRAGISAEIAVLELNPRILSVWVTLLVRRALRRRTVLWGHAWPRRGRGAATDRLRHLMRILADAILVYTETQARELAEVMPTATIVAAPNALYRASEIAPPEPLAATDFLFVGRLVPAKKPMLLLRAFAAAAHALVGARLVFVGEGLLLEPLQREAERLGVRARVVFAGHVGARLALAQIYARAVATVSSGYVGLSATQSFSFGVPMLVARSEPHSPEIEAAVEGENAVFFESDDEKSLADALIGVWRDSAEWAKRGASIAAVCRESYSVEQMADGFLRACLGR